MRHPGLPVATTCGRAAAREASLGASTARDIAGSTSVNRPALPQHWAASGRVITRSTGIAPSIRSGGPAIPGAPLDVTVAYDPPCHLMHAQGIAGPPERMLGAIPVLRVITLPDAAQCCGSAGLFTLVEPAMSRAVLAPKLASLAAARPQVVATGNPGCLMQLGAGLAAAGVPAAVRHPVELLDESYRAAGYYA